MKIREAIVREIRKQIIMRHAREASVSPALAEFRIVAGEMFDEVAHFIGDRTPGNLDWRPAELKTILSRARGISSVWDAKEINDQLDKLLAGTPRQLSSRLIPLWHEMDRLVTEMYFNDERGYDQSTVEDPDLTWSPSHSIR